MAKFVKISGNAKTTERKSISFKNQQEAIDALKNSVYSLSLQKTYLAAHSGQKGTNIPIANAKVTFDCGNNILIQLSGQIRKFVTDTDVSYYFYNQKYVKSETEPDETDGLSEAEKKTVSKSTSNGEGKSYDNWKIKYLTPPTETHKFGEIRNNRVVETAIGYLSEIFIKELTADQNWGIWLLQESNPELSEEAGVEENEALKTGTDDCNIDVNDDDIPF